MDKAEIEISLEKTGKGRRESAIKEMSAEK